MSKDYLGLDFSTGDWQVLGYEGSGSPERRPADGKLSIEVHTRITDHACLDPEDLRVRTEHGIVTLTGIVDTRHDRRLAERLVWLVEGVRDVRNQLRTRTQYE